MTSFKEFLIHEKTDIFGFDREGNWDRKKPEDDNPTKRFGIHSMIKYLGMHDLGNKKAIEKFPNEIHWGEGTGAVRVWIGTGLNVMIERQGVDLEGSPRWFTKRVYQIDRRGYGGFEDAVANEVLEVVKKIDEEPQDSAKEEYGDLENLVTSMASSLRRTARNIFIYEGIRKAGDNRYIIRFSVRGHGVEAPDQSRVLENQTHVTFYDNTGIIRVFNFNVESGTGSAPVWEILPSDTDWHFAPTQSREEIIETLSNTMHFY